MNWISKPLGVALVTASLAVARPMATLPGLQPDTSVLLPNQWSLRPVGRQIPVGDFPVNIAIHPGGRFAAVLHNGWGQHEVRMLDLKAGRVISTVEIEESFYGLSWNPAGTQLYLSGAAAEVIHAYDFDAGLLAHGRVLPVNSVKERSVPAGITTSSDGQLLYVAEVWGQRVQCLAATDGHVLWTRQIAPAQAAATMGPEDARTAPTYNREMAAAFPYVCLVDEARHRLYVSLWGEAAVLVLDQKTGTELGRWPVGEHPNELALARDGRLFVAEANLNSVSAVDTASGRVVETLTAALFPDSPPGSMPNSIALSPDGTSLFVANANNNNVAVFDVATPGHGRSLGFIPVGWFPTSVRVTPDGRTLVVANGKGVTSAANPRGPFPGTPVPRNLQEFIGGLMRGTVALIPLPDAAERSAQFGKWSKVAYACSPLIAGAGVRGPRPADSPIPSAVGGASPIKHVIYIVRENRTYDQVFGDMPEGNGAPQLCLFGENVTPNAHALAREFVLLDNFFADGEVSADGHEWTMAAYATDFVEKWWPFNYGHNERKKYDYPAEGRYPIAYPANGYLWNRAAEAGVSYRSYGEFCHLPAKGPAQSEPTLPILVGHIDPNYHAWDLSYADVNRADRFIAEVRRYETEGGMPQLQVLRMGNDHTSGTKRGSRTPTAMVADNDLALGRIVDAVTHSKFWADTAIFVLEDDAQNGPDHVDAHRMPALVISQWTKRRVTDSSLYSTTSMLRTIELILGLQPMSQFDAAALPLWASFQGQPDATPFTARPAKVDLQQMNPNSADAALSERMDFTEPDRVDDIVLNGVIWRSVRGPDSVMPAPIRAAFFKTHTKTDGDLDD